MKIRPIILAGGVGERLWPISRELAPKQFSETLFDITLFEKTVLRCKSDIYSSPIIVTNKIYLDKVLLSLQSTKTNCAKVIMETEKRNTAPAIMSAMQLVSKNEVLAIFASDHLIDPKKAFNNCVSNAAGHAISRKDVIVFGVKPSFPHTGYGYIEVDKNKSKKDLYHVKKFHEKPNHLTATKYIESKSYFWNCGIFIVAANLLMKEIEEKFSNFNDLLQKGAALKSLSNKKSSIDLYSVNNKSMTELPSISFDEAILEKTKNLSMMIAKFNWTDLGSWKSIYETSKKNSDGNFIKGNNVSIKSTNSILISTKHPIVADQIDDLIIINTTDVTYVGKKSSEISINEIKKLLLKNNAGLFKQPNHEVRPWGKFESIDNGSNFQVKRITVRPKQKLSTQSHKKRSEHWIVVKGTAHVYLDGNVSVVKENEHFFIPKKAIHSLENRQRESLVLIELQYGTYLGEDDITRYDDKYGRSKEK
jgi:mannose-1-phosphate guanylyltransferase/mannose-6-phosphate isomerase